MSRTKWMNAITTDRGIANRVAGIIGESSGDGSMFDYGTPCYPAGTTCSPMQDGPFTRMVPSQPAVAWAVSLAVRDAVAPFIEQFRDGGHPAPLLAAGMTDEEIDAAHAVIVLEIGARATYEGNGLFFIASQGYEIIPDA